MDITALMVAFLLHLQSEHDLTPLKTQEMLRHPRCIHHLVFQWADFTKWDLYIHMREAMERLLKIEAPTKSRRRALLQKEEKDEGR
jgi:hypothetical protein